MINIVNKEQCCGCMACAQVCPKLCIQMKTDEEGFIYPFIINKNQCIACGLCEKVCPILNQHKTTKPIKIYAGWNKNVDQILTSSSGGIFYALAEEIIKQDGIVFGATFNSNNELVHSSTKSLIELEKFKGSKYLQSNINNTYKEVQNLLKIGEKVLFVGTPCQISGLKNFLRKEYSNLITIDFICHGVPSPLVFKKHIRYVAKKLNLVNKDFNIGSIHFRNKDEGWRIFNLKIAFHTNENTFIYKKNLQQDLFLKAFLSNIILRPSCYNCSSKSFKSNSDITLSDFWGGGRFFTKKENYQGISSIFLNTPKGLNFIRQVNSISLREITYQKAYQETIDHSPQIPKRRTDFWHEIQMEEYEKTMKKYTKSSNIKTIINFIKRVFRKITFNINRKQHNL